MGFATLDAVKEAMGVPLTSTKMDGKINAAVTAINCEILACLGLDQCEPKAYELTVDLDCIDPVDTLWIEVQPVISVDEVREFATVLDPKHYRCRRGTLRRLCGCWQCGCCCTGEASVSVTVTAGFVAGSPAFKALQAAVVAYAVSAMAGGGSGLKREKIGRYEYENQSASDAEGFGSSHWTPGLRAAMGPYFRVTHGDMLAKEC